MTWEKSKVIIGIPIEITSQEYQVYKFIVVPRQIKINKAWSLQSRAAIIVIILDASVNGEKTNPIIDIHCDTY